MELLTSGEAADYLRLKQRKLYELVATGAIPCTKVAGRIRDRSGRDAAIGMARPDRLGDVGSGRADRPIGDRLEHRAGPVQQREEEKLRARPLGTQRQPRPPIDDVGNGIQTERIAGRDHNTLLAPREGDQHGVVRLCALPNGLDIRVGLRAVERMKVDRRRDDLAHEKPIEPAFAALRQGRQRRPALAQRPFEQQIVAAADDAGRPGRHEPGRLQQGGHDPAIELGPREQPSPGGPLQFPAYGRTRRPRARGRRLRRVARR